MRARSTPTCSLLLLVALLLAGCSGTVRHTAATTPAATPATFPMTVKATNGAVRIAARPVRIVSLSPTATEDLFAVGAGGQVVAVDNQSNYPPGVPRTSLSGYTPNLEAIAGYRPDLVVVSNDTNGVVAGLTSLSIPTLVEPAATTLNQAYDEMTQLGTATGHDAAAADLVQATRRQVSTLLASVPKRATHPTYYYELDQTLYTATSKTFVGSLFTLAGMSNVADPHDDGSGYPQLSAETLVAANPDFIFLADSKCCAQTPETVAARPGYGTLTAVKDHRIVTLDDDIASRWGPRVTTLLASIVAAEKAGLASPTP